jgi:large subunit ribosomal protein L54
LGDTSTRSSSGAALESTAGLSKGEARAAHKRNMKAVRSAQRGKGKQAAGPGSSGGSKAGSGMRAVGTISEGVVEAENKEEKAEGAAAISVQGASKRSVEAEKEAKKALRKASRENIKAKNFIGAR